MSSRYGVTLRPRNLTVYVAALVLASTVHGQTSFTYQGQLRSAGQVVNGATDIEFALWDSETGGSRIGSALIADDVAVTNGVFTVEVDFGVMAFNGDPRWLEISVRSPAGAGAFETLSPRQLVTAAPYAAQAGGIRGIFVNGSEQVGIGTITPQQRLTVQGNVGVRAPSGGVGEMIGFGPSGTQNFRVLANGAGVLELSNNLEQRRVTATAIPGAGGVLTLWDNETFLGIQLDGGVGKPSFFNSGNFGIGTTSPTSNLHISDVGPVVLTIEADTDNTNESDNARIVLRQDDGLVAGRIGYRTGQNKLEIVNEYNDMLVLGTSDNDALSITASGRVGIGTDTPAQPLEVIGNIAARSTGANDAGRLITYGPNGSENFRATSVSGNPNYGHVSVRDDSGIERARMYVDDDSNSEPCGTISTDVLLINGGADIAEPFDVKSGPGGDERPATAVQPGMVVAIDPANPGALRLCTDAYDRTVAGVISGAGGVRPGMMLRQENTIADGTQPVALTGRVYCYVDADAGGPVRPGDLLTTSDTPGHAMRVSDYGRATGATIGKAMSGIEKGRGLVLVLVNLH